MVLNLQAGYRMSRIRDDIVKELCREVGNANGPTDSFVDESFHCLPGLHDRHFRDRDFFVYGVHPPSWVLEFGRFNVFQCDGEVDEIDQCSPGPKYRAGRGPSV